MAPLSPTTPEEFSGQGLSHARKEPMPVKLTPAEEIQDEIRFIDFILDRQKFLIANLKRRLEQRQWQVQDHLQKRQGLVARLEALSAQKHPPRSARKRK